MIIRYIFKNGTEYLHAWQNCIDRMIGNKELDREIHSKENGVDYDFCCLALFVAGGTKGLVWLSCS